MAKKMKKEEAKPKAEAETVPQTVPVVVDYGSLRPEPDKPNEMKSLYRMVKRRLSDFSVGKKVPFPRVVFTSFVDDCDAVLEHEQRFVATMWCCVEKGVMSMNRLEAFTSDVMRELDAPYKVGEFTLSPVKMAYESHSGAGMRYSLVMMTLEPTLSESELKKLAEASRKAEEEKQRLLKKEAKRKAEEELKRLEEEQEAARIAQTQ